MNQQPPRIGIPARIQHPVEDGQNRHSHAYHFLEQTLAHWVMSHGAMLFMIPSLCEACLSTGKVLGRYNYAGALDGLILQGGPDIAPQLYGDKPRTLIGQATSSTTPINFTYFASSLKRRSPFSASAEAPNSSMLPWVERCIRTYRPSYPTQKSTGE